jgi:hypothetical protein
MPLQPDFMEDREYSRNTKSEEYRNNTASENALQGIVHELNVLKVAVEDVELIIKRLILAMLLDYEKKHGAGLRDIFVSKLFPFNEYINPCVEFVFHEPR